MIIVFFSMFMLTVNSKLYKCWSEWSLAINTFFIIIIFCSECGEICYRYIRGVQQRMAPHIYVDALQCSEINCMAFGHAVMSSIKKSSHTHSNVLGSVAGGHLLWSRQSGP